MSTFESYQFSIKQSLICQLKYEHNCSGKKRQTNARFMGDALKTKGYKCLNVETQCLFAHPY